MWLPWLSAAGCVAGSRPLPRPASGRLGWLLLPVPHRHWMLASHQQLATSCHTASHQLATS